jgi:hypothetical protein
MTGLNVAFTIPGDCFVSDKIDNYLTANPPEFPAGVTRFISTTRARAQGREQE